MTLLLSSIWWICRPFPSIWLNFTSHSALHHSVISHIKRSPTKLFLQCMLLYQPQCFSNSACCYISHNAFEASSGWLPMIKMMNMIKLCVQILISKWGDHSLKKITSGMSVMWKWKAKNIHKLHIFFNNCIQRQSKVC